MAKRKKRSSLPRVTVLAFSRKELIDFSASVGNLRYIADEMADQLTRLMNAIASMPQAKAARKAKAVLDQASKAIDGIEKEADAQAVQDRLAEHGASLT